MFVANLVEIGGVVFFSTHLFELRANLDFLRSIQATHFLYNIVSCEEVNVGYISWFSRILCCRLRTQ